MASHEFFGGPLNVHEQEILNAIFQNSTAPASTTPGRYWFQGGRLHLRDAGGADRLADIDQLTAGTGLSKTGDTLAVTGNLATLQALASIVNLSALAGAGSASAGDIPYFTSSTVMSRIASQSFGRSLLNGSNAAAVQALLSLVPDTDIPSLTTFNAAMNGLDAKPAAKVYMTTNVTVASPGATLDGVSMTANDIVILAGQTTTSEKGWWVWNGAAVPMTRATFADAAGDVTEGSASWITAGTHAGEQWYLTNTGTVTPGTTVMTFAQLKGAIDFTSPLSSITISGQTIELNLNHQNQWIATQTFGPASGGAVALNSGIQAESYARWQMLANGTMSFGSGASATLDVSISRTAADIIAMGSGDKLQQNQAPSTGDDLTNKTYVDAQVAAATPARYEVTLGDGVNTFFQKTHGLNASSKRTIQVFRTTTMQEVYPLKYIGDGAGGSLTSKVYVDFGSYVPTSGEFTLEVS